MTSEPLDGAPDAAAAVARLFDEHSRRILHYLMLRVDITTAEDLLSETFAVALGRWGSFEVGRDPLPWLWGITTNLLRRHWRHEQRSLRAMRAVASDEERDDSLSAMERLDYRRTLDRVIRELRRMRPIVRETILLYAWAELSYDQIAAATGVPIGTVRSRINRARTELRNLPDLPFHVSGESHARPDRRPRPRP